MRLLPLTLVLAVLLLAAPLSPALAEEHDEKRATISFHETPLRDALAQLAKLYEKNVIVHPDVEGTITLRMENVTWKQAIGLIAGANDLHVTSRDGGIITITNPPRRKVRIPSGKQAQALREEAAKAREAIEQLEEQRMRLAEASKRLEATAEERERVRKESVRIQRRVEKLQEEHARLRAEREGAAPAPKAQGTSQTVMIHAIADLGPGPHPALKEAIAAIAKSGGTVQEHKGNLVVKAEPRMHEALGKALRALRARRKAEGRRPAVLLAPAPKSDGVQAMRQRADHLRLALRSLEAAGLREEAQRTRQHLGALERRIAAAERSSHHREGPAAGGDRLEALQREVKALRGEVRDLTALVRKLLEQRRR